MTFDLTTPAALEVAAADIRRLHGQAQIHARQAIDYAIQAGRLLIAVKASVPHGEYTAWVESHCGVGERQARRYVAAAEGRLPSPQRLIADAERKTDVMSGLPELEAPFTELSISSWLTFRLEIPNAQEPWQRTGVVAPSTSPGFYHVAIWEGPADGDALMVYSRKPMIPQAVQYFFEREFRDWRRATVEADECGMPLARNFAATEREYWDDLLGPGGYERHMECQREGMAGDAAEMTSDPVRGPSH